MIESIKNFFQGLYDSTIGVLYQWYSAFALWVGENWDMVLYFFIFIVAIVTLWFLFKGLVVLKTLLSITVEGFIIVGVVAFVTWFAGILIGVYNKVMAFAGILNTGGDLGCFGHIISCLSIDGVLSLYFTQLLGSIIIILLMRMYQLYIWAKERIALSVDRIRFS